jgi:hypothetical protein
MSLGKKRLQRRIAADAQMRRHGGLWFNIINDVGDLPVADDDASRAVPRAGTKPPLGASTPEAVAAPVQPLRETGGS